MTYTAQDQHSELHLDVSQEVLSSLAPHIAKVAARQYDYARCPNCASVEHDECEGGPSVYPLGGLDEYGE